MTLHPGLVGQRVVVRRLLPGERGPSGGPALTDVLGVLSSWGEHEISIRREDGTVVTVPRGEIVAGKTVPPRPTQRRRPPPED
ncbi:MAG: hypothetical protein H0U28_10665 [Nocardioidaceae bacterium]|nr:hypothetical protein [Nocardioidaceae bacterium]